MTVGHFIFGINFNATILTRIQKATEVESSQEGNIRIGCKYTQTEMLTKSVRARPMSLPILTLGKGTSGGRVATHSRSAGFVASNLIAKVATLPF